MVSVPILIVCFIHIYNTNLYNVFGFVCFSHQQNYRLDIKDENIYCAIRRKLKPG